MTPPLSPLAKSARSPRMSVTSCDIVVVWVPSQVHIKKPWDRWFAAVWNESVVPKVSLQFYTAQDKNLDNFTYQPCYDLEGRGVYYIL